MTLGNSPLCRVSGEDTRQRVNSGYRPLTAAAFCRVFWFAECLGLCRVLLFAECSALGKPPLCRVPVVCRVPSLWHSVNSLFAERPIKNTRQSMGHSAKKSSPVVLPEIRANTMQLVIGVFSFLLFDAHKSVNLLLKMHPEF